jgi:hypothetical protein
MTAVFEAVNGARRKRWTQRRRGCSVVRIRDGQNGNPGLRARRPATFHAGDENDAAGPGAFVALPKGIPHTFTVDSPAARFVMLNAPGGFERMFELAPRTIEDAVNALQRYGVEVVGPHPRETLSAGPPEFRTSGNGEGA